MSNYEDRVEAAEEYAEKALKQASIDRGYTHLTLAVIALVEATLAVADRIDKSLEIQ